MNGIRTGFGGVIARAARPVAIHGGIFDPGLLRAAPMTGRDQAISYKMTRTLRNFVMVAGVALALAACGKKSDLQRPLPPPDVPKDASGKNADPGRPFILDPLVR